MRIITTWTFLTLLAGGLALVPPVQAENETSVAEGTKVVMEYSITVPEARITIPKNVSQFVPGHNDVLPNLEKALTGMKKGEEKRVDLSADEAFGQYDDSKKAVIATEQLPSNVKPGSVLTTEEGIPFVVVEVKGEEAQVDFNHPLAGKHVIFDIKILEIEPGSTS